jgi:hypothetical protein
MGSRLPFVSGSNLPSFVATTGLHTASGATTTYKLLPLVVTRQYAAQSQNQITWLTAGS